MDERELKKFTAHFCYEEAHWSQELLHHSNETEQHILAIGKGHMNVLCFLSEFEG